MTMPHDIMKFTELTKYTTKAISVGSKTGSKVLRPKGTMMFSQEKRAMEELDDDARMRAKNMTLESKCPAA